LVDRLMLHRADEVRRQVHVELHLLRLACLHASNIAHLCRYAQGMARTSDSPAAPRVSPPDLPARFLSAEPERNADLIAATLELSGSVDLAYSSLEQCLLNADVDTLDLTGATLLDVD